MLRLRSQTIFFNLFLAFGVCGLCIPSEVVQSEYLRVFVVRSSFYLLCQLGFAMCLSGQGRAGSLIGSILGLVLAISLTSGISYTPSRQQFPAASHLQR